MGRRLCLYCLLTVGLLLGWAGPVVGESSRTAAARPSHGQPDRRALPVEFVRGVNYAHVHRDGRGYGSATSARTLGVLRQRVGVNAVALTPFGYQRGHQADRIVGFDAPPESGESVGSTDRTLTDARLAREIDRARALGLHVMLKPHIWSHDFWGGEQWHGTVDQPTPAAHARWWRSYRNFILHYAELAERHDATALCLGTELVAMSTGYPDEWRALIRDVREVYRGHLTYAAHWESEFERIVFWDELDFIGVAAYFPLDAPAEPTRRELIAAWRPHLDRIAAVQRRFGKPVIFAEVGYRPVADAHAEPWTYSGGRFDPAHQARVYDALFAATTSRPWFRGAFLWKAFTDPAHIRRRAKQDAFVFRGYPAERIIADWFDAPEPDAPAGSTDPAPE